MPLIDADNCVLSNAAAQVLTFGVTDTKNF